MLAMKINEEHLYHGAALIQIAEFSTFKAINPFILPDGSNSRSTYVVNTDKAVYLKYASKPKKPFNEYVFTFSLSNLKELEELERHFKTRVFVAMVCLEAQEICAITLEELKQHIERRKAARGKNETSYQIIVTAPANSAFRVYVNEPGKKKSALGKQNVRRNHFPGVIFA